MVLFFVACKSDVSLKEDKRETSYSYTVKDYTGAVLKFDKKPTRIVSFTISTDEMLVDLVPKERIVALGRLVDDPSISYIVKQAKEIKARAYRDSAENILGLKPDLVIIPTFIKPEVIQTFKDLGIKVYVYETPTTLEEIQATIKDLGNLVGEPAKAEELINGMNSRISKLNERLGNIPKDKQVRVAFIRHHGGANFSPKSSFTDICRFAQVHDVTTDLNYDKYSVVPQERLVVLNPEAFVVADWNYDGKNDPRELVKNILDNKGYKETKAVKNNKVVLLPGKSLLCYSHHRVLGIEALAQAIYPERFK